MKRVLLTVALCVAASASFAQKKAVNEALSTAKTKNYAEARELIKPAFDNAESKNDAKTWYVAGYIEDQQYNDEKTKQILGQAPNEPVMYTALYKVLPYYLKAYQLDQQPNEKGKIKPKYEKDIKGTLQTNRNELFNGGAYYFDQHDYQHAYDFFNQYIEISELPMFAGTPVAAKDTMFMTVQFYAAVAATQLDDHSKAIAALSRAKDYPFRQNDVYQYLCYEYEQAKDTASIERTLEEGLKVFPDSAYYLNNLINIYIYSGRNEKALESLNLAIQKNPNDANLYNVMGRVYETGLKDDANAETYFKKALELDPTMTDAMSNIGRVYFNRGVVKLDEANRMSDQKQYKEASDAAKELFKQALPFYKEAHAKDPSAMEYMIALRGIYYNLNMGAELDAIEKEMQQ